MSTDPTGLGNQNCEDILKKQYMNVKISKEEWCTYQGECLIDNIVLNKYDLCMSCKHKRLMDVPSFLLERNKRKVEKRA